MSSRRRHQARFEQDSGEYSHHQRPGEPFGNNEYDDLEISLTPAFEDLDVSGTRESRHRPYPLEPAGGGALIDSPLRSLRRDAGRHGDLSPMWHHAQAVEQEPGTDARNSLGLSPGDQRTGSPARAVELFRRPAPASIIEEPEEFPTYGAPSPRQGRYSRPPGWQTSQSSAPMPGPASWGYRPYPDEEFAACGRAPEILCRCRTCVEHRRGIRGRALYPPRSRVMPLIPVYPSPASRRYRTRDGFFDPGEGYYSDSPGYDSGGSSYDSRFERVRPGRGFVDSPWPRLGAADVLGARYYGGDRFGSDYDSFGSDHEYSDSASYTGYERYDDYYGDL